ncbi:hypothetical protein J6590_056758 [Homalodisca vitripennis]|nr:hypothetical protein J6590_056758 [Homalodisca vitripennis]
MIRQAGSALDLISQLELSKKQRTNVRLESRSTKTGTHTELSTSSYQPGYISRLVTGMLRKTGQLSHTRRYLAPIVGNINHGSPLVIGSRTPLLPPLPTLAGSSSLFLWLYSCRRVEDSPDPVMIRIIKFVVHDTPRRSYFIMTPLLSRLSGNMNPSIHAVNLLTHLRKEPLASSEYPVELINLQNHMDTISMIYIWPSLEADSYDSCDSCKLDPSNVL